jgi:hypothetical protein
MFIRPFSVRQILVDAIFLKFMPIAGLRVRCLCGAERLCAAQKIRKRADTIKHTRDSVRMYHDARRSFWIAPIGYVDSCIVYTRKHWSDTEHAYPQLHIVQRRRTPLTYLLSEPRQQSEKVF